MQFDSLKQLFTTSGDSNEPKCIDFFIELLPEGLKLRWTNNGDISVLKPESYILGNFPLQLGSGYYEIETRGVSNGGGYIVPAMVKELVENSADACEFVLGLVAFIQLEVHVSYPNSTNNLTRYVNEICDCADRIAEHDNGVVLFEVNSDGLKITN